MSKRYYATTTEGQFIKVEIDYELGGISMFTYKDVKRGYYAYFTPVKRSNKYGCVMESCEIFSGFKILLLEVGRKSQKKFEEAETLALTEMQHYVEKLAKSNGLVLTGEVTIN